MSQRRWLLFSVVLCAFAGPVLGQSLPVTIEWVDPPSGQPLSQVYEFSSPSLRVTDGGSAGLGSLSVRLTSDLRGDEEWLTLWEDPNNPGVFSSGIYVPATLATDPPAQDSWLEVTESAGPPLQRDTIRAFFESCSTPPCPADAVPTIGSTIRLTDGQGVDIDFAFPGQPVSIEVRDYGAPYWAPTTATVVSQSGDSETVSLPPDFGDPNNPVLNVFRQSIAVEIGSAVPGDGVLQVQDPDAVIASHPDPLGLSSSTDSAAVAMTQIAFLDRSGTVVEALMVGGDIRVRAVSPSGNADPGAADTVTATVRSRESTGGVRDTESLQLFETGPDTAVFTGVLPSQAHYWTTIGDGVLQVWRTDEQNDTVEAALGATTASATLIPGFIRIVDASGADVTNIPEGGTVYLRAEYEDGNDPNYQGSFFVRVLSLTTGDQQYVMVWETGLDTGVFEGSLPTVLAASPIPFNEQLETQSGETIRASLDHFFGSAVDLGVIGEGTPSSNPPNAVDDAATTADDLPVTIDVLANDSDPDGHAIQIWSFTQGAQGGTVGYDNGLLVYTPPPYFTGIDTFTYIVRDLAGDEDSATVTVTVAFVNDPPSAIDDAFTTDEDLPAVITPTDNDRDPENQALRIIAVTQGSKGTVAIQDAELGYVSYTPQPNAFGSDSFTYTLQDPQGATGTATVSVTINPLQDPPVAVDDAATTAEDTLVSIYVRDNDSDPDGDTVWISNVTQGAHGQVGASATYLNYLPAANYNGTDSFTYTINDGNGNYATATVTVTITPVQDSPTAVTDSASTTEDVPVTVTVLANDSDPDGDSITLIDVTQAIHGSVTINADGTALYTPEPDYNDIDRFDYTIRDSNGNTATGRANLTITAVNDPPNAVDDSVTVQEDNTAIINVASNDSDVDGDPLSITGATQGAHGTVEVFPSTIRYTPAANYNGIDTFTYTLSDGRGGTDTATVTVTIAPVVDVPVAVNDSATTAEETPIVIDVLGNDTDPDGDNLTIFTVTQGANGSVTFNSSNLTYSPHVNFTGSDSFTYTNRDATGFGQTATVTVTVTGINDNPVAANDSGTTAEDSAVTISVLANDTDVDGDALSVTAVTQGATGSVTFNAGSVTYTPAANFNGADSFTYTVSDGNGGSATATVTVTVSPENDAPVAAADSASTSEDSAANVNVLANDNDVDGDSLSITAVTQGSNGAVTFNASSVSYTPNANFNGSDSFTYSISDGNGGTATATVSITVNAINDSPSAENDSGTTTEDSAVTVSVLANDSDPDGDTLSITAVTQGNKGSVTFTASSVTYTPAANVNGSDSFTYTVADGNGGSATATVSITIAAVNDAPDAVNDAAGTSEDVAVILSVLANDTDVDGEAVSLTGVTQGTRGSVAQNADGTVTYTPNPNSFGADAFTYTVRDAAGLTDSATVIVNVASVNDPPDAIDDSAVTNEGGSVAIAVLANDTDLEGDALSISVVSTPAHGTAAIDGNTITYTPSPTYSGADSFTYTMSDGPATDTATVAVQVKDVIGNVAVLGIHSVWIQSGADVLSGDVVTNEAGSAPFLSSTEVSLAGSATTAAGWDVQGNRVTIASGAVVASDVYFNQLANGGSISGAQYTPLSLPVFATLPAFQSASPGSTDVNVANNGTRTLAPGSYRDLIVGRKATVTFTGGIYHFRSIRVDRESKLFFSGGSEVRVQQKVSTNTLTTIGPGSGSSAMAASIVFYVAGVNGTAGGLSATPKAVEIGTDNTVAANLYAPNGTLWLKDRAQATGAFLGLDVQIGVDGQVSLRSAW